MVPSADFCLITLRDLRLIRRLFTVAEMLFYIKFLSHSTDSFLGYNSEIPILEAVPDLYEVCLFDGSSCVTMRVLSPLFYLLWTFLPLTISLAGP